MQILHLYIHPSVGCKYILCRLYVLFCRLLNINSVSCMYYSVGCKHLLCRLYALLRLLYPLLIPSVVYMALSVARTTLSVVKINSVKCTQYSVGFKYLLCRLYPVLRRLRTLLCRLYPLLRRLRTLLCRLYALLCRFKTVTLSVVRTTLFELCRLEAFTLSVVNL